MSWTRGLSGLPDLQAPAVDEVARRAFEAAQPAAAVLQLKFDGLSQQLEWHVTHHDPFKSQGARCRAGFTRRAAMHHIPRTLEDEYTVAKNVAAPAKCFH